MPLSIAEGLAQRERGTTGRLSGQFNRFCGNTPCCGLHSLGCHKDVRCETDLRAVHNGFDRWRFEMVVLGWLI